MKTAYRYYIHHNYEYVYYAVPKVCTRTILEWLLNNKCINFDKLILSSTGNYYPAPYYRPRLPKEHQTYFTFAFCRNPFDRLVSLYFNKVIGEKSKYRLKFYQQWEDKNFKTFVSDLCDIHFDKLDGHAKLQNSIIPKNISFLGRFENFIEDFDYVTNTLFNKSFRQNEIHSNKTQHKHYSEYYNKNLIQKVYKKYHQDFERFGYTF